MPIAMKRSVAVAAAALAGLLAVSACSSSGSSGGTAAPAGSSASASSSSDSYLAQIEAAVKEYKAGPTSFAGPATPVSVAKNVKLAIIPCAVSIGGCEQPADAVKSLATSLGWQTTVLDGQSNPRTQNQMIQNAVSSGATAIITVAVDYTLVQQGLTAAKKAGIPVISMNDGIGTPNPKVSLDGQTGFSVDVSPDYPLEGKMMADWIIADSQAKAHVLMVITKDYLSNVVTYNAFQKEMATCKTCTVDTPLTFTTSEIASGSLGTRTVGYLRNHSSVDYIFTGFDAAAAGEITAINQAGLRDKVKLVSVTADNVNRGYVRNGDVQQADVVEIPSQSSYAAVDQTLRLLAKQPLATPDNEGMGAVLLTKENMLPDNVGWKLPFDLASEYQKIWTKG